jgi:hypothetical protein
MEITKLVLEFVRALVWPLTVLTLSLFFRGEIKKVLARLRKAVLPGGVSVDLQEEVQDVKELSETVQSTPPPSGRKTTPSIPLTEVNARMFKLGLAPMLSGLDVAYFRSKAETDPVLALAGLRIDLETMMRNVAVGFKLQFALTEPISRLLARLREAGSITPDQKHLAQKILSVCNQAMHGRFVSRGEAEEVVKAAEVLFQQYLAWLSWGFDDNWKPSPS